MIKLESIHIEETRGIRRLNIDFNKNTFAISGPNGSGKSGVIDAIEFGLTGQIGRLAGRGTGGLSVSEHGPHVDKARFPESAFVKLKVFLPSINKSVIITRKLSSPTKPKIEPDDRDVIDALVEVANHPEITLSRREILRFILIEPAKRSEEIQTILKLNEIGQIRSSLKSANTKLLNALNNSNSNVETARLNLQRHLQIATLRSDEILSATNTRRKLLGLSDIVELTADVKLDAGLEEREKLKEFNKESALRDAKAILEITTNINVIAKNEVIVIAENLNKSEGDSNLFSALKKHSFIERGLDFVDGVDCPLCDLTWENEELLRKHIFDKLAKSNEAKNIINIILENGATIVSKLTWIKGILKPALQLAKELNEESFSSLIASWITDLDSLAMKFSDVEQIMLLKKRFEGEWIAMPYNFSNELQGFLSKIESIPDQSAIVGAQTYLTTAQIRLSDYREVLRQNKAAKLASLSAKEAYDTYCKVMDEELNSLYEQIEKNFSIFYSAINSDDESTFTAKLTPNEGSLGLDVNFYNRGLFPPAAYHSEGHQDGMGVCLYLALMKHLYGEKFTFALFDDVVMSVDTGHRYQFCSLLKKEFPNTQFIITTHDRLWAEQMKSAGLVTSKSSLVFYGWTIEAGPLVESNDEIWHEISNELNMRRVDKAAAGLRHHLEYTSRHLADLLGAAPRFRADGNYELGDLLPSVTSRMKNLYCKAADASKSWENEEQKEQILDRKKLFSDACNTTNHEQWAVNKAIHYNEWANFSKEDFEPVIDAFKKLLLAFTCNNCHSWLYITPRINSEALRCNCNLINFNLKPKSKTK